MRKIAHLSDLHFGKIDPVLLPALAAALDAARPDLVVVSGDLTQRARIAEFEAARDYLDSLPFPRIVVPGNHDVPLYDVFRRALSPLRRYRRYFGQDAAPSWVDPEIAVVGINTARSLTFKDGRINRGQVALTCQKFQSLPDEVTRIIVTHHPFERADLGSNEALVGRAAMAMAGFSSCRVDLILSGHLHAGRTDLSVGRYDLEEYSALMIQAGTATSVRRRRELNSFNIVRIARPHIVVELWAWDAARGAFAVAASDDFVKTAGSWSRIAGGGAAGS